ncbi:MAG TPA: hypothetical protein VLV31_10815 [Candidatus Acidoferrales bacterium]|nr:hypothetical protein [Candidatus Acidoferrales bacterium]
MQPIQEFLAKVNPKQKKFFTELRAKLVVLPDIEESIDIDDVSGEWCPAYRVKGSDLVWVHFDEHLWVNFPVEPNFEKKVLQDENLDSAAIESVKEAEVSGDEKWAKVEIKSAANLDQVIPLLELRHTVLSS